MAVLAESLVYALSGSPQTLSPSHPVGTSSCLYSLDYDMLSAVEMEACHLCVGGSHAYLCIFELLLYAGDGCLTFEAHEGTRYQLWMNRVSTHHLSTNPQ